MNLEFQDAELFADFIIEAREHLETIEPTLLELEKAPDNLDLLNDIFRPMHSLKGASGFLGLNKINQLAHRAESVLDELRKGTMSINSEIMDIILAVTDALSTMINILETHNNDGDNDYTNLLEILDAILSGEFVAGSAANVTSSNAEENTSTNTHADDQTPAHEYVPAPPAQEIVAVVEPNVRREVMPTKDWLETRNILDEVKLLTFSENYLSEFVEEIIENIDTINELLLMLEKNPQSNDEIVADLFRNFHNIKGGSGIIDYKELNNLTHEAETLLNKARHKDIEIVPELVDLLLFVSDVMSALVQKINLAQSTVAPYDTGELLQQLQKSITGEETALPQSVYIDVEESNAPIHIDSTIVDTSKTNIREALAELEKDASQKDKIELTFNSLIAIRDFSQEHSFAELAEYAQRTANLVEQAIKSDLDFSLMLDLLRQEVEIIFDLSAKTIDEAQAAAPIVETAPTAPPPPQPTTLPTPAPAQEKPAENPIVQAEKPVAKTPEKPAPPQEKPAAQNAQAEAKGSSTIRVDHEKLDALMNLIGELIINRNRYSLIARHLEESKEEINISQIGQALSENTYALAHISNELQDTIMKVRMVPVSSVFARFPRLVRDLSRKSGKEVELVMEGEETELDKSVVEVIGDPLVHLIRNSVDHGIESAEERLAAGKSEKGKVTLRAYHKGNSVFIEIEDDGKGIDPEKMREVAVKKGVITSDEAKALSDSEAVDLIFAPGFSSAAQITDISGRGVGMDVVKTNIKNLKGTVSTTTEIGKGTRFTLSLPLTLAIIDALTVNVSGQIFAIPLDAVSETTKIETKRLADIMGKKAVTLRGEVLGLMALSDLLNIPRSSEEMPEMLSVVILLDGEKRLGLVVDRMLERQEIVIKPLGTHLADIKGISGSTIMGDGSVLLILDPHEIYTMSTLKPSDDNPIQEAV